MASDLAGVEFDWLATDEDGHVALLTTAGSGVVPPEVAAHVADVDIACERLPKLAVVGEARDVTDLPGEWDDWLAAATRGVYAYDWRQGYQRVCAPTFRVPLDRLPTQLKYAAGLYTFPGCFADAEILQVLQ